MDKFTCPYSLEGELKRRCYADIPKECKKCEIKLRYDSAEGDTMARPLTEGYKIEKAFSLKERSTLLRCPDIIPPDFTPTLTTGKSTQDEIAEITDAMKDLLLYKNKKYGDSALNPKKIFYKGDSTNSILIRLDDKLGRIMANKDEKPRVNDVADIIGYCTLLLISMGVTKEDIAKFKD